MNSFYYETVRTMQNRGVDPDYLTGWVAGFLHSAKREVQRLNEAYEAGYADGTAQSAKGYEAWIKK